VRRLVEETDPARANALATVLAAIEGRDIADALAAAAGDAPASARQGILDALAASDHPDIRALRIGPAKEAP
jgi:hypothetical protein